MLFHWFDFHNNRICNLLIDYLQELKKFRDSLVPKLHSYFVYTMYSIHRTRSYRITSFISTIQMSALVKAYYYRRKSILSDTFHFAAMLIESNQLDCKLSSSWNWLKYTERKHMHTQVHQTGYFCSWIFQNLILFIYIYWNVRTSNSKRTLWFQLRSGWEINQLKK